VKGKKSFLTLKAKEYYSKNSQNPSSPLHQKNGSYKKKRGSRPVTSSQKGETWGRGRGCFFSLLSSREGRGSKQEKKSFSSFFSGWGESGVKRGTLYLLLFTREEKKGIRQLGSLRNLL